MSITLLSHASIPLQYWDYNFASSVHVINRFPTAGLAHFQSPFHALCHKFPKYDTLEVFGYSCFPFTQPYNKHKL